MPDIAENPLIALSEALAERVRLSGLLVAGITAPGHRMRSGTLWRKDVVVASEQRFPDAVDAKVTLADGTAFMARVAGRDPGTNVVALQLDGTLDPAALPAAEPRPGGLALALGADDAGISVRLGVIRSVGPVLAQPRGRPDRSAHHPGHRRHAQRGGRAGARPRRRSSRHLDLGTPRARSGHSGLYGRNSARTAALEGTGRTGLARLGASARPRAGSAAGRSRPVAGSDGDERLEGRPRSPSKPARRRHSREDRGRERHEPHGGCPISRAGFGRKSRSNCI